MTRYARAQGSKSCNAKLPSTSTAWNLLKKSPFQSTDRGCEATDTGSRSDVGSNDRKVTEVIECDGSWFDFGGNTRTTSCRKELKKNTSNKSRKQVKLPVEQSKNSRLRRLDEDLSDNFDGGKSTIPTATKNGELIVNEKSGPKVSKRKSIASSLESKNASQYSQSQPSVSYDMAGREKPMVEDRDHLREMRRKAKAKKREKKKLCFCCRRWGHQLSDCPEFHPESTMETNIPAGGFCYRCGSTEHMVNQCSKPGNSSLKFARCFICGGEGHLARDCSENPNGKYPKGGSCLVCGSKNHLGADCPKSDEKDGEEMSAISCMTVGPVDSLPEDLRKNSSKKYSPSTKRIKF